MYLRTIVFIFSIFTFLMASTTSMATLVAIDNAPQFFYMDDNKRVRLQKQYQAFFNKHITFLRAYPKTFFKVTQAEQIINIER